MPRTKSLYKSCFNAVLDDLKQMQVGENLPPETTLSTQYNTSRTTIRSILRKLHSQGLIEWDGRNKLLLRYPEPGDFYPAGEAEPTRDRVERAFMTTVLRNDLKTGARLHESELAREIGVSASVIREFLIKFSGFGLVRKEPNRHWVMCGFTKDFADELLDMRDIFEVRGLQALFLLPEDKTLLPQIRDLKVRHDALLAKRQVDAAEFAVLDEDTHRLLIQVLPNRFVDGIYKTVSLVSHYHYLWEKSDEALRNRTALSEHLEFIDAILAGDEKKATQALKTHLASARRTLHETVSW